MPGLFDDATDPYTQPQQQPDPSSLWGWLHSMLGNAGQQQQAEAGASQAMQPAVTGYLGDVASGQMAARAIPQDHYDPSRSFAQNALDPQALEQAQNIAMGFSGGGLGIKAYHGSPYDFDAFDASKIGTGEGAQAYGHGLYFAESEPVARSYRDALSPPKFGDQLGNAADLVKRFGSETDALSALQSAVARNPALQVEIDAIKSGAYKDWKPPGHMYEVDINADPQSFLPWDKPASQWANAPLNAAQDLATMHGMRLGDVTGERLYNQLASNLSGVSGYGRYTGGDTQAASDALLKQGVPGISYLDANSRRMPQMYQSDLAKTQAEVADLSGALKTVQENMQRVEPGSRAHNALALDAINHNSNLETAQARLDRLLKNPIEATSNYVVFDPKIIDILRKYAVPGLISGGAAAGATSAGNP